MVKESGTENIHKYCGAMGRWKTTGEPVACKYHTRCILKSGVIAVDEINSSECPLTNNYDERQLEGLLEIPKQND